MSNRQLWTGSGIAGVLGVACYLAAITIPWPENQTGTATGLLVVSTFPILSIIYSYGLYHFIAAEQDGVANRLAFIFAVAAFTTVLAMIIVQLAVGAGIGEIAKGLDEATSKVLRRGLRLIDHGLDVAWDMLIGTALIFLGRAVWRRGGFGPGWGIPLAVLGIALIGLNAATFPWPPADRGLFDVGPFVGIFMLALAVRLVFLGRHAAS